MTWILLTIIAFISGSLPFSVWLGRLFLHRDVRAFGDGNPGAMNVFRAGGRAIGVTALLLDVAKAAAPVGVAYFTLGIRGLPMFMVAIAPLFGHVFSPFLGFQGGKAVSAALGVWIGLTIWKASLAGVATVLIGLAFTSTSSWAVLLALVGILVTLVFWMPDPLLLAVWVAEALILAWTHRADLSHPPHWRPWLIRRFFRSKD